LVSCESIIFEVDLGCRGSLVAFIMELLSIIDVYGSSVDANVAIEGVVLNYNMFSSDMLQQYGALSGVVVS